MKLRINSDDFGYSKLINKATEQSLIDGIIHSTSILVNFEEGFKDALIRLSEKKDLYFGNVGIHLNLTEGKPLTEEIRKDSFFCTENYFHSNIRKKPLFFLNARRKKMVLNELQAQIDLVQKNGIKIQHIDSHHHVHTEWALIWIVIRLAKKNQIKKVRISRNLGKYSWIKAIYKKIFNLILQVNDLAASGFFGSIEDFVQHANHISNKRSVELMVHVNYNGANIIVDMDNTPMEIKNQELNNQLQYRK